MARRWVQAARGVARLSGDSRDAAFHIRQRETRHSRTRPFPSRQRTYLQGGKALQPRLRGRPHPTRPGGCPSTPSARPPGPGGLPRPAVRRGREPPREGAPETSSHARKPHAPALVLTRLQKQSLPETTPTAALERFSGTLRTGTRRPRPPGAGVGLGRRGARGEHAGPSERG